jgi:hypothetical protein
VGSCAAIRSLPFCLYAAHNRSMSRRTARDAMLGSIEDELPPAVFRHFIYLDKEEVLNALSAVQGGAVEEAVDEIVSSGEGSLGLSIKYGGQGITLGSKSAKELKRGLKRRQTVHAAIAALLHALRTQTRKLPEMTALPIDENELVQFQCEACHCRSEKVVAAYREEVNAQLKRNWFTKLVRRGSKINDPDRANGLGRTFVALASTHGAGDPHRFVLLLRTEHLVVPPEEFSRRVNVVGQVVAKPCPDEQVVLKIDSVGTTAHLVGGQPEDGGFQMSDLRWSSETGSDDAWASASLIRPLCIFK